MTVIFLHLAVDSVQTKSSGCNIWIVSFSAAYRLINENVYSYYGVCTHLTDAVGFEPTDGYQPPPAFRAGAFYPLSQAPLIVNI